MPSADARSSKPNVSARKSAHEPSRRLDRRVLQLCKGVVMRLTHPERGRDLLANRQPLTDAVVLFGLFRGLPAVDTGDHGGSYKVALKGERGPGGHIGDWFARHGSDLTRHQREQANDVRWQNRFHRDARCGAGCGAEPRMVRHKFFRARVYEVGDRSLEQAGQFLLRPHDEPVARSGANQPWRARSATLGRLRRPR